MKKIQELHRQAIDYAEQGELLRLRREESKALEAFNKAFELERRAALSLERSDLEPSRSILFRSAAALALECGLKNEAVGLAEMGLVGNPPEELAAEMQLILKAARPGETRGGGSLYQESLRIAASAE